MPVPCPRRRPIEQDRRVRFTSEQISDMRRRAANGETQVKIAAVHGTDQSTVSRIVRKKVRRLA